LTDAGTQRVPRRRPRAGAAPPRASARPLGVRAHGPHPEAAPSPGPAHTEATGIPCSPTPRRHFTRRSFGVPVAHASRCRRTAALKPGHPPSPRQLGPPRRLFKAGEAPSHASHARPRRNVPPLLPVRPPPERRLLRPSPS
jgi:hypothetical protein